MKKTLILTAAILGGIALPSLTLAETPVFPGADAAPCDPAQFTPIFGKNGDVLYWNNPTCVYAGSDQPNPEPEEVVEDPVEDDDEVADGPGDEDETPAEV